MRRHRLFKIASSLFLLFLSFCIWPAATASAAEKPEKPEANSDFLLWQASLQQAFLLSPDRGCPEGESQDSCSVWEKFMLNLMTDSAIMHHSYARFSTLSNSKDVDWVLEGEKWMGDLLKAGAENATDKEALYFGTTLAKEYLKVDRETGCPLAKKIQSQNPLEQMLLMFGESGSDKMAKLVLQIARAGVKNKVRKSKPVTAKKIQTAFISMIKMMDKKETSTFVGVLEKEQPWQTNEECVFNRIYYTYLLRLPKNQRLVIARTMLAASLGGQ